MKSTSKLRRMFWLHFGFALRQIPGYNAFLRLAQRFTAGKGQVRPQVPSEDRPLKQKVVKRVKDTWVTPEEQEAPINSINCAIIPFSCHCLAEICRLHGLWRSAPARASRPRKSQKVHPTSGSCGEALCLDRSKLTTKIQMSKCSDANVRLKWANKPCYANFITILKLSFFMKHPVSIAIYTSQNGCIYKYVNYM